MLRPAPRHHGASLLLDGIVDHAASSANPNLQATLDRYVYSGFKRISDAMSSPYRHSRAAKRTRTRRLGDPATTVGKPFHACSRTWRALTSGNRRAHEAGNRRRSEDLEKPDQKARRIAASGDAVVRRRGAPTRRRRSLRDTQPPTAIMIAPAQIHGTRGL